MSAAAATPGALPPGLALWQREVETLSSGAEALSEAAREMVRTVLLALADDPASDLPARRDIRRMLSALEPAAPPPPEVLPGDPRD